MGQRSQIYIRYNSRGKKGLIARYFSWNYGHLMISRTRWAISHILSHLDSSWYYNYSYNVLSLERLLDVYFEGHQVSVSSDIIEEYKTQFSEDDFNDTIFLAQDNNDGKLFIDIGEDVIKYAFLNSDTNIDNIMDCYSYMDWDIEEDWKNNEFYSSSPDIVKACEENIWFISKNAVLMTTEDIKEFISYDYVSDIL